jgi:hypothetical protein
MATPRFKFPHCRLVLSGVVWCRDMTWQCIKVVNDRYNQVAKTLGVIFIDRNSWIQYGDFGRGRLNLTQREVIRLGHFDSRLCNIDSKRLTRGSK